MSGALKEDSRVQVGQYCSFLDHKEGGARDLLATFGTNLWRKKIKGDLRHYLDS